MSHEDILGTGKYPGHYTRRQLHPAPARPELDALVKRAIAAFDALPPDRQRELRAEQRRSWVIGELMLSDPNLTREAAAARVARAETEGF